jgi:multidrug resistance efflux pump
MSKPVYEPIKTPLSRRIQEFRVIYLPAIVFILVMIVVISLWNIRVYNPTFIGRVEGDVARITAPEAGVVQRLYTDQFDRVLRGDTLLVIQIADTSFIQSRIAVMHSQITLLSAGQDPIANWQRNRINYAGLRLDLMQERVALSTLLVRKVQTERNLSRLQTLAASELIAPQELEDAQLRLDLIRTEITQRTEYIEDMEELLQDVDASDADYRSRPQDPITAAIRIYEAQITALEEEFKPRAVLAPFDGIVGRVWFPEGSTVPRGEAMLQIESMTPKRIVGYMRQPLLVRPEPGMNVHIRTRTPQRFVGVARLNRVGAQFVPIVQGLQRPGVSMETGLPVEISLDGLEHITLLPGEIVDIILR